MSTSMNLASGRLTAAVNHDCRVELGQRLLDCCSSALDKLPAVIRTLAAPAQDDVQVRVAARLHNRGEALLRDTLFDDTSMSSARTAPKMHE